MVLLGNIGRMVLPLWMKLLNAKLALQILIEVSMLVKRKIGLIVWMYCRSVMVCSSGARNKLAGSPAVWIHAENKLII